jgi:dolichol-phosphate mannosyltransferase
VDELNRLPESQRFLRGLRAWVGFKAIGVPYVRPERMFGTTTNSLTKNLTWARRGIVSFSYVPLEFILMIAVTSVVIALVAGVVQISLKLADPSSVPSGFTTLILLILLMGGLILLALSIIGFYIADIYAEVKQRPPFVVDTILNPPEPRTEAQSDNRWERSDV